ncbi:hypothetical protein OH492_08115 [Vibrio chagasii]|nr:hypothetical protein [Vibrio chagasii]
MEVKQAGVYRCAGIVNYDSGTLAQSACKFSLSRVYAMSLSVNNLLMARRFQLRGFPLNDKGFLFFFGY